MCIHLNIVWIIRFPVARLVEHGASNKKVSGSIPKEGTNSKLLLMDASGNMSIQ